MAMERKELFGRVKTVVVKIGTASLSNEQGGLDEAAVARLAEQIHALRKRGAQVILVTSGAISAGVNALGLPKRPTALPELQACAAVGQGRLIAAYDRCFRQWNSHAAQMLLTREDFNDRRRYLNAFNTLKALLRLGAVPVINENDTISVDEITFSDNDRLAALVTSLMGADLLVLLTVVEGLLEDPDAPASERRVVPLVEKVNDEVRALAGASRSRGGKGGMASKLESAHIANEAGAGAVIACAKDPRVLERLFDGEPLGTLFLPGRTHVTGLKRWLRHGSRPKGTLTVDAGARRALVEGGKSLLPGGVTGVTGQFERGDLVAVQDDQGREFARGLVNYSSAEMQRIKGQKTAAVRRILPDAPCDEAIHRDHLALGG